MTSREFEIYFRRLYLPLGMYALRYVEDADVAEDLEQNAFMKAWMYIGNGGEIVNFEAFMYRAVRNACLSWLRGRREMLGEDFMLLRQGCENFTISATCRKKSFDQRSSSLGLRINGSTSFFT